MPELNVSKDLTYSSSFENYYPGGSSVINFGQTTISESRKIRTGQYGVRTVRSKSPKRLGVVNTRASKERLLPWYRVTGPQKGSALKRKKSKVYSQPKEFSYSEEELVKFGGNQAYAASPGNPGYYRVAVVPLGFPFNYGGFEFGRQPFVAQPDDPDLQQVLGKLQNEAAADLLEQIRNVEVSFGQLLAERKQTIDLLQGMVKNLALSLLALKQGKLKQAYQRLNPGGAKGISNGILATNFGLTPLVDDIDGIAKHLAQGLNLDRDIKVHKQAKSGTTRRTVQQVGGELELLEEWEVRVTYKARVSAKSGIAGVAGQLGLLDIAGLAWELTPWSFVADWFTNIGDVIQSLASPTGVSVEWVTKTTSIRRKLSCVLTTGGKTRDGYDVLSAQGGWIASSFQVQRKFVPIPTVSLQIADDPLSLKRALNSLALAHQRLK